MRTLIASSRYLVIIAVVACFALAIGGMLYGAASTVTLIMHGVHDGVSAEARKHLTVEAIEMVDLFLLSTVFLITGFGLYSLFIDEDVPAPAWLSVHGLDALKAALLKVIVVALAVNFLSDVVGWDGSQGILYEGAGIAMIVAAVTYFVANESRGGH